MDLLLSKIFGGEISSKVNFQKFFKGWLVKKIKYSLHMFGDSLRTG